MKIPLTLITLLLISCQSGNLRNIPLAVQQSPEQRKSFEASGKNFVVATQGPATAEAVRRIHEKGGNIIDAAVAASFAISVERPQSTGIGGGGFLLYRNAKSGRVYAIDFRERAPLRAHAKMYLDSKGEVIKGKSIDGIHAVAVPGLVAGLLEVHGLFGQLSREEVLAPAIELAEQGFEVYPHLAEALVDRRDVLAKHPDSAKIFLDQKGRPLKVGDRLVQKDLARTLQKIAKEGASAFYRGSIARALVDTSDSLGGILTARDLESYKVIWREPVRGTYKGHEIISMSPPSSGGTHVIQILNILENDSLRSFGYGSPQSVHLQASAMQQAFADRAQFMGDPDFNPRIPLKGLLSKDYARSIRTGIDPKKAKTADEVRAGDPVRHETPETTNFAMMDSHGNVVVSTQTINGWMGSGVVAKGTGILLNNEMDDFSAKPGAANLFGAIGGDANSVQPRKTPLSSMSPTIVVKDQQAVMAVGAPGGTRIITCVAQAVINYIDFRMPLYETVAAPRIHQQWRPDKLTLEPPGFSDKTISSLQGMGYQVAQDKSGCRLNAVAREKDELKGAADPRDIGAAWAD